MKAPEGWKFGVERARHFLAGQTLPIDSPLMVVELADAYVVAVAGDRDDWVVEFARTDGIDAAGWAQHMVQTYNLRLASMTQADADDASRAP